jgi:hypothetical protein
VCSLSPSANLWGETSAHFQDKMQMHSCMPPNPPLWNRLSLYSLLFRFPITSLINPWFIVEHSLTFNNL